MTIHPSPFLRRVLALDAIASGATGLIMALGAGLLADPLGLPEPLLRGAGLVLLPFAMLIGLLASRARLARGAVWAVVIVNALWVVDSVLLLIGGWVQPTTLGVVFVAAQAVVVGILAELQVLGLRRGGGELALAQA